MIIIKYEAHTLLHDEYVIIIPMRTLTNSVIFLTTLNYIVIETLH